MKTVIITQARMGSKRLPGKVMKTILNQPVLKLFIERISCVSYADEIVVATTKEERDTPIVSLCGELGVQCFKGKEYDVLNRYYQAAKDAQADIIVRLTSDCPLIDPKIVDRAINLFKEDYLSCDYLSNTLVRSYPKGMDVEVFSMKALEEAEKKAKTMQEREHVTLYLYKNLEKFRLKNFVYKGDFSHVRLTLDTQEDFDRIQNIYQSLYPKNPKFSLEDILKFLKEEETSI